MRILHVVPGLDEVGNGISVAARLIANEQRADLVEARLFASGKCDASQYDEVWVHSAWSPLVLRSCRRVLKLGKRLVRMAHANYDPVRLRYHGWKKTLAGPIERFFLRRAKALVVTCEAEKGWIESYLGRRHPPIALTDIKRFFKLESGGVESGGVGELKVGEFEGDSLKPLHLLYLGRRHPLKGLEYLEEAVKGIDGVELRIVSNVFEEEKERVWDWCDVLVLPTLTDNFGLVVAEALERGKRVITTDGAPAWDDGNDYGGRLIYLKGYRDGTSEERIRLLKNAISKLVCQS